LVFIFVWQPEQTRKLGPSPLFTLMNHIIFVILMNNARLQFKHFAEM